MSFREVLSWIPVLALVALLPTLCSLCAGLSGTSKETRLRLLLAAAIAPLAFPAMIVIAGLVEGLANIVAGESIHRGRLIGLLVFIPWAFFRFAFGAYVGSLVVGAPLLLLLWRLGKLRWTWVLSAGLFGGAMSRLPFGGRVSPPELLTTLILTGAAGGAAVALIFWWIAVRGNEELATRPRSCNSACNSGNDGSV